MSRTQHPLCRAVPLWLVLFLPAIASPASAQRNLKNIPDPDPELERNSFLIADGFEVNLYASDPLIAKPIQMNFDAQGRLWIASSTVYPHIKPGQEANDKILVVEDTDQDGTADQTSVFADGLLIPTGVIPGDGGAYVCNSTELLHLRDTNGDGKADRRRIVLSGFGTEDTHHLLHTLRWGHDGCLYMNQSIYIHSHIETPYGVKRLNGGGIWRFRPETLELEVFCEGFVNPWGHHFDRWGQSFATDGAYREGINYVFPGAVFVTAPGAKRILTGLNPGSPKHCGLEIVSGRHLPDDWQGNMLTNDFRAHRVCRFVVTEDQSGYASRQEVELIKSSHVAFRPIDVKMGPDGAIYIADWYNPIIQHGEVDFRDPRRDHVHGRIWRVTAKDRPLVERPKWNGASIDELLEVLKQPEAWNRLHAKLLLKKHDADEVDRELIDWVQGLDPDKPDYDHHRLEALWAHQAIGRPRGELAAQLRQSKDHRVQAAAIRVASDWMQQLAARQIQDEFLTLAEEEPHPRVMLETVRALAKVPTLESAETASRILQHRPLDRFLDFALWRTMRDLAPAWVPALRRGEKLFDADVQRLTYGVAAVDSREIIDAYWQWIQRFAPQATSEAKVLGVLAKLGGPQHLGEVLDIVLAEDSQLDAEAQASTLSALVETCRQRNITPAGDLSRLAVLLDRDEASLRTAAMRAIGVWKQEPLRESVARIALDPQASRQERDAAIDSITAFGGPESVKVLNQLSTTERIDDRLRAVNGLSVIAPKLAARRAVSLLEDLPPEIDPAAVIGTLLSRKKGPAELTAALADRKLPADTAKLTLRAVRSGSQQSPELVAAVQKAGGLTEGGWELTPELRRQLVAEVAAHGDPQRGEAIYRRKSLQCMKCHAIGGAGGRVGPDMISVGASAQVDYLIDSLLTPNSKLKENFHSLVIATDDGRVVTGIPIRQNEDEIVLRDAEDRELTIAVDSIEQRREGRSLMPKGTVDSLTRAELVDLVSFLSKLGKVGEFAIGRERVVRRWETLAQTPAARHRLNRTSFDIAATDDAALTWQPAYSRVAGDLPLEGLPKLKPHRETPQTTFLRFELDVSTAGPVQFNFASVAGLKLWVDDKPTPIAASLEVDLSSGRHRLTLAVDRETRTAPLRIELVDAAGSVAQAQIVSGK